MAFVYDPYNKFENYVNSTSVVWQIPETKHWMNYLKKLLEEYNSETNSIVSKKILNNFSEEVKNFKQVCPVEMLDKLKNPINLREEKQQVI
jgi:glutamate synthase (NADPH/NADH) large chain